MVILLTLACTGTPPEQDVNLTMGPEIRCTSPVEGFSRFSEEGLARGLNLDLHTDDPAYSDTEWVSPGTVNAEDIDGDGDIDLVFWQWLVPADGQGPVLWLHTMQNDGTGHFTERFQELKNYTQEPSWHLNDDLLNSSLVDMNGDSRPDLLMVGLTHVLFVPNAGDAQWGAPQTIWDPTLEGPHKLTQSMALGDIDGDGDLDVFVPGNQDGHTEEGNVPAPVIDHLLRNPGTPDSTHMLETIATLTPAGEPGYSRAAMMTDRDGDGDLDLLVLSEHPPDLEPTQVPATAFYRNDGLDADGVPSLINDAPSIQADLALSGKGIASRDLNEDGTLDHCVSDMGAIRCLMSSGRGTYDELAGSMGLVASPQIGEAEWVTWSLELEDFDADGLIDAALTAGHPSPAGEGSSGLPDAIWQGTDPGADGLRFVERTEEVGFGGNTDHYGMAAADVDGDGFLDLIQASRDGRPSLWMNSCSDGHWTEIRLEGTGLNRQAIGARIDLFAKDRSWSREIHALRGSGQSPSRVHVGLGQIDLIDELRVTWPDGSVSIVHELPTRRTLTLRHPQWTAPW